MTVPQSLVSFLLAASLLTVTPGLDTALVLRTAAVEGPRRAVRASLGIGAGCLAWGCAVALGLGALLAASENAFTALKWAGAAYLMVLGLGLLLRPRAAFAFAVEPPRRAGANPFLRGLLGNLLNPKVGVFYVSFLPGFVPAGMPVAPFVVVLTALHAALGLAWCGVLVSATRPLAAALRRPGMVRTLDRLTGVVFIGFGVKLALARR